MNDTDEDDSYQSQDNRKNISVNVCSVHLTMSKANEKSYGEKHCAEFTKGHDGPDHAGLAPYHSLVSDTVEVADYTVNTKCIFLEIAR